MSGSLKTRTGGGSGWWPSVPPNRWSVVRRGFACHRRYSMIRPSGLGGQAAHPSRVAKCPVPPLKLFAPDRRIGKTGRIGRCGKCRPGLDPVSGFTYCPAPGGGSSSNRMPETTTGTRNQGIMTMRWLFAVLVLAFIVCQSGCCGCRPGLFGQRYYQQPTYYQPPVNTGCAPCQ